MASPPDPASPPLADQLEAALSARLGVPAQVLDLAPLAGGACQESARLDLALPGAPRRALVLRGDATSSLPGSLRRAAEFAVVQAAFAAGVQTPEPHWLLPGLLGPGRDAWIMDRVGGEALGRRIVHHPRYAAARARLAEQVAASMAALQRVSPATSPTLPLPPAGPDGPKGPDPAAHAMRFVREMLEDLPQPRPELELVVRWLDQHRPPPPPRICLVHGDLRTGNLMVDENGLVALLDWEFAHWGDPAEDVAWLCVRDWRFGRLDRAAGGWATRATLYQALERAGAGPVDPVRVHWWEVLGNLRWAAGSLYQGERFLSGEAHDIELLAIPWRVGEMSWEALRLVAQGPPSLLGADRDRSPG